MHNPLKQIDTKEVELPETTYVRDIETKVFQSIVVQCLLRIEGIALIEGNLIDNLFGREPGERITGISVEQDPKTHSISVKLEINVAYGICIPDKADEIQTKVTQELSRLTGLHVSLVHVIFKNLITRTELMEAVSSDKESSYSEEF
ncbi:MAG TPA: Asp23/Gls24 family envelope stress response protein [Rhabdochlamydiaceae bacterium]|nr:Asp23/Gls24 family envelope stress response protein [Rhabdochlamydiaceae bacterium]